MNPDVIESRWKAQSSKVGASPLMAPCRLPHSVEGQLSSSSTAASAIYSMQATVHVR